MAELKHRPEVLPSKTTRMPTAVGMAFVTLTYQDDEPAELFVNVGKAGSESFAMSEAIGRLVSVILRLVELGTPRERLDLVIDQLSGIGGTPTGRNVRSVPDAIAHLLAELMEGGDDGTESSCEGSP